MKDHLLQGTNVTGVVGNYSWQLFLYRSYNFVLFIQIKKQLKSCLKFSVLDIFGNHNLAEICKKQLWRHLISARGLKKTSFTVRVKSKAKLQMQFLWQCQLPRNYHHEIWFRALIELLINNSKKSPRNFVFQTRSTSSPYLIVFFLSSWFVFSFLFFFLLLCFVFCFFYEKAYNRDDINSFSYSA